MATPIDHTIVIIIIGFTAHARTGKGRQVRILLCFATCRVIQCAWDVCVF